MLIIADQFRHDCIAAGGNAAIQTPHLDALMREGVSFRKHFVQSAPCGPSRMCLYTGRYMCSTRSVNNMTPLVDAEDNVARWMRDGGYASGLSGYNDYALDPRICAPGDRRKTHLDYDNFLPGFDVVLDHEHHSPEYFAYLRERGYPEDVCTPDGIQRTDVPPEGAGRHLPCHFPARYHAEDSEAAFQTANAVEHLHASRGKPWFFSLNYIKPHPPHICAAPYHAMYDPAAVPAALRRADELDDPHPYFQVMKSRRAMLSDAQVAEVRACYYGMITELDVQLGRLFQALKDSGQWDNTLILFTSDHGEYLGDHFFLDKAHFYDATMRVPLIIRDPSPKADATRGQQLDCFSESIDIVPTMLEYAGVSTPDRLQGVSLLGAIRGLEPGCPRREAHFEYDFRDKTKSLKDIDPDECLLWVLRDDDYKYVQFGVESFPAMLYDMRRDPGEWENLAQRPECAGIVADYAQRMLRWRMKNEDQRMEHWAYPMR